MASTYTTITFDLNAPMDCMEGTLLTQEQRDAVAERIEKVLRERKRLGRERRMLARQRQLQSIDRARERYQALQPC